MKKLSILVTLCFAILFAGMAEAEPVTIKLATVAPDGSTWMKVMRGMAKKITKETNGEVKFAFYPGGTLGDDKTMAKKMKYGQIHAAGFTGVGNGEILPEIRVLEAPFLIRTPKQAECAKAAIIDELKAKYIEKGYVLLGIADVGFVYLFSTQQIKAEADLANTKPWMWKGDPIAKGIFKGFGISATALKLEDVMASLQTGLIDTVYNAPMAMVALTWYTQVKSMIDLPITNAIGTIVIKKDTWDKISPEHQKIIQDTYDKYLPKLVKKTRSQNKKSIDAMVKNGLVITKPSAADKAKFEKAGKQIQDDLAGKIYSKAILEKVRKAIANCK